MYEHHRQRLLSRRAFVKRLACHGGWALLLVLGSLTLGTLGFHVLSSQRWVDAFLNGAMLLGGMGPVGDLGPALGKIFAALYALYAGLVFLIVAGLFSHPCSTASSTSSTWSQGKTIQMHNAAWHRIGSPATTSTRQPATRARSSQRSRNPLNLRQPWGGVALYERVWQNSCHAVNAHWLLQVR
ncbi:MAG: hypothetical protein N3C12_06630 [Candidatus Binatia bacterium]|nr:hypothetical protein [Candidatus Binatia bacterium]